MEDLGAALYVTLSCLLHAFLPITRHLEQNAFCFFPDWKVPVTWLLWLLVGTGVFRKVLSKMVPHLIIIK
jgi:hypothetical protein